MEILIKSNNTSLLERIVEVFKDATFLEGKEDFIALEEREIDVNEENKELVIINIE
jgi:hypothetical protein